MKSIFCYLLFAASAFAYEFAWTHFQDKTGAAEFWTCDTSLLTLTWDFTPLGLGEYSAFYDHFCGYPPAINALLLCAKAISDDKSEKYMEKIYKIHAAACDESSSFHYPWTYYKNQFETNGTINNVPLSSIKNTTLPIYVNTTPNITLFESEYRYYKALYFNSDSGTWFSVGIYGFFALLFLFSAIHNFCRHTVAKSMNSSSFVKTLQKYFIFPTIFPNGRFNQEVGFKYLSALIPNRIQFLCDVFLFALQIAFYSVDYRQNDGVYYMVVKNTNWSRFVADRTGIMAFGKIPLLILFAGRNNFLLWCTGWSYSTFLHFHKSLAYWMTLDTVIHSVAYTIHDKATYSALIKQPYFACGIAGTVICCVMVGAAVQPIRRFFYEYFLFMHVIFAIAFIVMCWYHCRELGWMEWLIAACCVWFFDRLVRVIRCAAFGYRTATVSIIGEDLIKLQVSKPSWWFHKPGTYCYVYFANWIFWENHPFTTVIEGHNICAYIKVKMGVTARVYNTVKNNGGSMQWKVCLEGPYGGEMSVPVRKFDETLLIAGGSGAPGILEHAAAVSAGKLIWVAQNLATVRSYKTLIKQVNIDIELYITGENDTDRTLTTNSFINDTDSGSEDEKRITGNTGSNILVLYRRPNLWDVIDINIQEAPASNVAIIACGPPRLMDEVRNIVSNKVSSWDKSIDFFDEFQVW